MQDYSSRESFSSGLTYPEFSSQISKMVPTSPEIIISKPAFTYWVRWALIISIVGALIAGLLLLFLNAIGTEKASLENPFLFLALTIPAAIGFGWWTYNYEGRMHYWELSLQALRRGRPVSLEIKFDDIESIVLCQLPGKSGALPVLRRKDNSLFILALDGDQTNASSFYQRFMELNQSKILKSLPPSYYSEKEKKLLSLQVYNRFLDEAIEKRQKRIMRSVWVAIILAIALGLVSSFFSKRV